MSRAIYQSVDGIARSVRECYVGINGVARKITEGYIGIDGIARKFWGDGSVWFFGQYHIGDIENLTINSWYAGFEEETIVLRSDFYQSSASNENAFVVYAELKDGDLSNKTLVFRYIQCGLAHPMNAYTDFIITAYDTSYNALSTTSLYWYSTEQTGTKTIVLPEKTSIVRFELNARRNGANDPYWILTSVDIGDKKYL